MKIFLCAFVLMSLAAPVGADSFEDKFFAPEYSKKVSMDFKDAALTDVLKIFSKQSGLNFVAAQDVSSHKVTLFMENIPVEEALDRVLDANDLTYEMKPGSDVFIVRAKAASKEQIVTRVYPLKHASVPSSKIKNTIAISGNASSSSSSTASASLSGSSSGGGIYAVVKSVLTKAGTLVEDARTNSLIVTDVESRFPVIEQAIAKLDVPVPQILIEVEMLDISKNTSDLMGVKFGSAPLTFAGASKTAFLPFNQSQILKKLGTNSTGASGSSSTSTAVTSGEYTLGTISAAGMTAALNFLKTRTDTRNLAKPRLLTLNNETAEIKISTNEAIGVSSVITGSSQTISTKQAERVQTGVFLTVTPQADPLTREIVMAVYPKVIQARSGATFDGQTFKDPEERGSQSILKIQDGETIVIGGLLRTDESNTVTKLPILGDIPFVGAAFRHKDKTTSQRELVIFITPHIVDDGNKQNLLSAASSTAVHEKENLLLDRMDAMNKELSSMESGK